MMKRSLIAFLFISSLLLAFQNCSDVHLAQPEENSFSSSISTGSGLLCLEPDETLESLYVTNLNAKMVDGFMQMDSDADGVSDQVELQVGSDPLKRRTSKNVLDSICQEVDYQVQCSSINVVCSNVPTGLGLSDCDIRALRLDELYSHPNQGLDSDKDGIPDLLEIRGGTFPNVADATEDPDHDLRENQTEIEIGSEIRKADPNFPNQFRLIMHKKKLAPAANCAGERWQVDIDQVPLVHTRAFQDSLDPWLNHSDDENAILITLKTRPKVGVSKNAKVRRLVEKAKAEFTSSGVVSSFSFYFDISNFNLVGEVEP